VFPRTNPYPLHDRDFPQECLQQLVNREAVLWYCDTTTGRVVRDEPFTSDSPYALQSVQGLQISFPCATTIVRHSLIELDPGEPLTINPYYDYSILTIARPYAPDHIRAEDLNGLHDSLVENTKYKLETGTRAYATSLVPPREQDETFASHRVGRRRYEHAPHNDSVPCHRVTSGRRYRRYTREDYDRPHHPVFELFDFLIDWAMPRLDVPEPALVRQWQLTHSQP